MEAAGLAIGALALVGVFEDCVTLLSQIGAAKSMDKDYILLATRLDFQKTLLLQWANRLKLYDNSDYDTRLDDPIIARVMHNGLACIRQILQDGHKLQKRYGLRQAGAQEVIEHSTAVSNRLSSSIQDQSLDLRTRYPTSQPDQSDLSYYIPRGGSKSKFSISDTIKWVIKDKEQFEVLVRDLSNLITDMDRVIPGNQIRTVLKQEIQALDSVQELNLVMDASVIDNGDLVSVTKTAIERRCAQLVLNRLWFRLIDERRNNIVEAHSKTLEWAINPPASGAAWDDLDQWLQSGRRIYWIHGKPGSGKSTLMKFLYNHSKTMSSLQTWAGNRKLTMASFFLWNIGSPEQSSQEGLARGLLHHVLVKNPTLIPLVLPDMWQEAQSGVVDLRAPSHIETKTAFEKLGAEKTTGAYAFFIDGLDEFAGNHRDGILFVKDLVASTNIKIIVSSRPIDTCVAAFSSAPKLRLQDLTASDIGRYVNDAVQLHACSANYSAATLKALVSDVRSKADGVFLWVVLACRALIEGFEAYDSVEELRLRVDELPPELESLFRHILNGLPARYLRQAAQLLRVCYIHRSLRLESHISAVRLAWAHEKNMETRAMGDFTEPSLDERQARTTMFEGRLRSRCRGLLEVYQYTDNSDSHIDFMHRTVFEFLSTPNIWVLDCLHISDDAFDASKILAYMSCYALYNQQLRGTDDHEEVFLSAVAYTRVVEQNSPSDMSRLLNRLAFASLYGTNDEKSSLSPVSDLSLDTNAVLLAIELGFTRFAQRHDPKTFNALRKLEGGQETSRYSLLYHAFMQPLLNTRFLIQRDFPCAPGMIDLLIRSVSDPNDSIALSGNDARTCWGTWMESKYMVTRNNFRAMEDAEITMMMVRAGAALVPPNPDDPSTGVAHIATKDHRGRLRDAVGQWLRWAPTLPELQDRIKLKALCDEITTAVAASYEIKSS
ncbi:hypothetical protein J4E86_000614 [Alternaria arbusti]|uniref:uncharacterized protein n=1 Tax=Alternaria arbusti TaxID=232088 RepID=UPI00222005B1|nr:uncharacterized protein J4E86_000614 [Alternaria arbusti]KAI4961585.1 hypothetical protein J4E86_000614 [Alternaria arbusti]